MKKKIGIDLARKVLSIVDAGLVNGIGEPKPGKLCVEAAVCLALGEPHGDRPSCVAEPDREFKIRLNDARWSSPKARALGMRRLSIQQLGTAGTDRSAWRAILVELTIRRVVPEALEIAAKLLPLYADAMRAAAELCATEGTRDSADHAANAAASAAYYSAAAAAAAADAASNAAASAIYAAVNAAASAAYYSAAAAAAAADAANAAYYSAAAADAAADAANAAYYSAAAADAAADAANAAANAAAESDRILTIGARCAEEAYERTGSTGVELLREIEIGGY